jgi:sec-independent protein translocase protein TatB
MFGIGFGEVLVIAVILIIVVGPARLPALMATLGKTLRSARQASDELRSSLGLRELMGPEPWDPYRGSRRPEPRNRPGARSSASGAREKEATGARAHGPAGGGSQAEPGERAGAGVEGTKAGAGAGVEPREGAGARGTDTPGTDTRGTNTGSADGKPLAPEEEKG